MFEMLRPQSSRGVMTPRPRPKLLVFIAFALFAVYLIAFQSSAGGYRVVPWSHEPAEPAEPEKPPPPEEEEQEQQIQEPPQLTREQFEQNLRDEFAAEYEAAKE